MDEWERFNKTSLLEKEELYSNLNIEEIADTDYNHTKTVCKDFEIKNLGKYHNLYLKNNTLLLADAKTSETGNFMNQSLQNFFSFWINLASGLD